MRCLKMVLAGAAIGLGSALAIGSIFFASVGFGYLTARALGLSPDVWFPPFAIAYLFVIGGAIIGAIECHK
jgi:hypothetical protein